jgi:hypothetical protein
MQLRAFAGAATLLTNASQVPESLRRWLLEASVQTDLTGVPAALASKLQKQETRTRRTNRSQIFRREENQDEMANA